MTNYTIRNIANNFTSAGFNPFAPIMFSTPPAFAFIHGLYLKGLIRYRELGCSQYLGYFHIPSINHSGFALLVTHRQFSFLGFSSSPSVLSLLRGEESKSNLLLLRLLQITRYSSPFSYIPILPNFSTLPLMMNWSFRY